MDHSVMKEKVAKISILANVILAAAKIAVGFASYSSSVLADGIHSFADIFSSAIGYFGIKASKKPADEEHPYGHFKFEVLSGAAIALILFITGAAIVYDAYTKFLNPTRIEFDYLAFTVMILSAAVNEIMARVKIHFGEKENSIALISDGTHSRVDVFTSLAVFIGLFVARYWIFTDSILAFLIGVYIIKESFSLGKEAIDSLLDVSAGPEIEAKIRSVVEGLGVKVDSIKTQKKGYALSADLEIELPRSLKIEEATEISDNLRKELMERIKNLSYVVIQIKSHETELGFYKSTFGRGFGWQRQGKFKEKIEEAKGRGPGGECVCPKCGYKISHQSGVPCATFQCPVCLVNLERK